MQLPRNGFKAALPQAGESPRYGIWAGSASAYVTEIVASAGYDWILLDGEHAPNNAPSLLPQLQAVAGYPVQPIVRAVDHNPALIKQLLDIGSQTLMIPMVESADQARALVRAMRYPPAGIRGVGGGLTRATRWDSIPGYIRQAHEELCLIAQIESRAGVENATTITAVDGVDAVFIGPTDLATSLGHAGDVSHPEVQECILRTVDATLAQGKACGILAPSVEDAQRYASWGCTFIAIGIDLTLLRRAAVDALARHRQDAMKSTSGPGY